MTFTFPRNLRQLVVSQLSPVVVLLDEGLRVIRIHGNPAHYGYAHLKTGMSIVEALDFMVDLPLPVQMELPFMATPSGRIAQVQIDIGEQERLVVFLDVTEQHRKVQQQQQFVNEHAFVLRRLLRLEKLIGCLFKTSDLRFWTWNVCSDLVRFDPDSTDVSRSGGSELSATEWHRVVHPDEWPQLQKCLQSMVDGSTQFFEVEHRIRGSDDDEWIWVLNRGTLAEHDETGQATYVIGIQLDIHQRKMGELALRESEHRFRMLADTAPVLVWMSNEQRDYTYFNRGWCDFGGLVLGNGVKVERSEGAHPEDWNYCEEMCDIAMRQRDSFEIEYRFRRTDGSYRWLLDRGVPRFDESGEFLGYIGTCIDITERVDALAELRRLSSDLERRIADRTTELEASNAALRKSEERYALVARATEEGLWDWNLVANEIYYSPRWKAILGYSADEIGISPDEWKQRVHPDDRAMVMAELDAHVAASSGVCACEYRMLHKDGTYHWYHQRALVLRDENGLANRIAGSHRDISRRRAIEEQLLYDAIHDGLTGLANRTLLMDRLRRCIERRKREEESTFALLFMDLDRFKVVNDSLGHIIGDRLLVEVAKRLHDLLRVGDTLARLGGDEFAILLENIRENNRAIQVAERIHNELSTAFDIDGNEIYVGASIGIALSKSDYRSAEDMIRDADTAMYRAKAQGLPRYQVFDSRMHAGAMRRMRLENDLRGAIERQQLVLHYQPVVNVEAGSIVGFEALLRWQHPEFGMVSPTEFISLAEETGLIVPIGAWVLHNTCQQARSWQQAGIRPVRVAVNLSSVQFRHNDLTSTIRDALNDSQLDPGWLDLEVTESTLMLHLDSAISTMRELKDLGLMLSMDDFGTGYSSLSCLKRFPLDTLKIDQSFVRDIATDPSDAAIVTAIGAMAVSLKMDVIAEGVETAEQMHFLLRHDCRKAQGFYFSPPVTADGALALLQSGAGVYANEISSRLD